MKNISKKANISFLIFNVVFFLFVAVLFFQRSENSIEHLGSCSIWRPERMNATSYWIHAPIIKHSLNDVIRITEIIFKNSVRNTTEEFVPIHDKMVILISFYSKFSNQNGFEGYRAEHSIDATTDKTFFINKGGGYPIRINDLSYIIVCSIKPLKRSNEKFSYNFSTLLDFLLIQQEQLQKNKEMNREEYPLRIL